MAGGAAGGTVVTGRSASRLVAGFLEELSSRAGARFVAVPVVNHLMGESVTVTGLLGGNDIAAAVRGNVRGTLYIPSVTLRDAGDLFLDGLSLRSSRGGPGRRSSSSSLRQGGSSTPSTHGTDRKNH